MGEPENKKKDKIVDIKFFSDSIWYSWHSSTCNFVKDNKYMDKDFIKAAASALEREVEAGNLHGGEQFYFACDPHQGFLFSDNGIIRGFRPLHIKDAHTAKYSVTKTDKEVKIEPVDSSKQKINLAKDKG